VTGGSSGIGRATCGLLAEAGATVVAVGRSEERLEATRAEVEARPGASGASVLGLARDVRQPEEMERMAEEVVEKLGRIDILVSSAGVLRALRAGPKPVARLGFDEWTEVIRTNLGGTFLATRAVLPTMMRQRSGDIVTVSSTSGLRGYAYDSPYCSSKFGIIGFSEALREEVRRHGIRVQTLLPGPVDTGIWEQNRPVPPPEKVLPVERVAESILYLLTLPADTQLENPVVIPFRPHHRPAWRAPGPGVAAASVHGETSR